MLGAMHSWAQLETACWVRCEPNVHACADWCMNLRVVDPLSPDDFGSVELVLFSANVQLLPQMKVPSYGQLHAPTGALRPSIPQCTSSCCPGKPVPQSHAASCNVMKVCRPTCKLTTDR